MIVILAAKEHPLSSLSQIGPKGISNLLTEAEASDRRHARTYRRRRRSHIESAYKTRVLCLVTDAAWTLPSAPDNASYRASKSDPV
jgi:hypothetical protein